MNLDGLDHIFLAAACGFLMPTLLSAYGGRETGQVLHLSVTIRWRCLGSYRLGNLRCLRASGSARHRIVTDTTSGTAP